MAKQTKSNSEIKFLKPEHLDFEKLIKEHEEECKLKNIRKPQLEFIIDALIRSRINNRKEMEEKKLLYTPLCAELLQKVVANYNFYLRFLLDREIIISSRQYIPGSKCTGFNMNPVYNSQAFVETIVSDYRLKKAVKRERAAIREKNKLTAYGYKYLTRHWESDKLDIDEAAAIEWIEKHTLLKMAAIPKSYSKKIRRDKADGIKNVGEDFKQHVKRIKEKDYDYRFSGLGHRFYNPISNLKRELRNFLTFDGEQLVDIDISNSQPFMSLILFNPLFWSEHADPKKVQIYFNVLLNELFKYYNNNNSFIMICNSSETQYSKDFHRYKDLVLTGTFYDYIQQHFEPLFPKRFNTRQRIKKEVLIMFFSQPRLHETPGYEPCLVFKKHFPTVYKMFTAIEEINNMYLPSILQRIESFLVIDVICKQVSILHPEIPLLTIHDNIITTKKYEGIVRKIMAAEIEKWTGYPPPIDSKDLLPTNALHLEPEKAENLKMIVDRESSKEINTAGEFQEAETNSFTDEFSKTPIRKIIDICTNEIYANDREAASSLNINHDQLILFLNSEDNPTCLRYAC